MKARKIVDEVSESKQKATKNRKPGFIRKTSARGADKRTRTTTLRLGLPTEILIFVCAVADQKDVAEFIDILLEKYTGTQPQRARLGKLKTMAAANNTSLELYLREMLETRFTMIEFNWDEASAIEMCGLK